MSDEHQVVRVWMAENLDGAAVGKLRAEIRRSQDDPDYSIVTNFSLSWLDVARDSIICAEYANEDQVERVRKELDAAWEDPDHIAVLPVLISVQEYPR